MRVAGPSFNGWFNGVSEVALSGLNKND